MIAVEMTCCRGNAWQLWLAMLLACTGMLAGLGRKDFVASHEARVGQTARRMADAGEPWNARLVTVPVVHAESTSRGVQLVASAGHTTMQVNSWLLPVMNGSLRLQKPPLPYWCAAMWFDALGVTERAARLTPAILGILSVPLIYDLARRLRTRRIAIIAALIWISTYFIVDEHRKAMADPYLAFFTLASLWAWVATIDRPASLIVFYLFLSLGALAKGPVIFLTVIPALVLLHWTYRLRIPQNLAFHLLGLTLFLLITLPWPIYVLKHVPNAMDFWRYESVGEFADNAEKARPWWLYVASSFQLALPWTPIWMIGMALPFIRARWKNNRKRWFAIAWYLSSIVIFSFAHVKKIAYLLPTMPAQTLIVAEAITFLLAWSRRTKFTGIPGVILTLQSAMGIAAAGLMLATGFQLRHQLVAPMIIGGASFVLAVFALREIFKHRGRAWLRWQVIAYAGVIATILGFVQPAGENRRSPRVFALRTNDIARSTHLPLFPDLLPEEVSFYLPLDVQLAREDDASVLVILDDNRQEIERGRIKPDVPYFRTLLDSNVTDVSEIPVPAAPKRWKLYEVRIDRTHA